MFVALLNGSVDGPIAEIETVLLKPAVSFVFCYVVVVVHLTCLFLCWIHFFV